MANKTYHQGVYAIRCAGDSRAYVGCTTDLEWRWWRHRRDLACGRHSNRQMQAAWDQFGEEVFTFEVLEPTTLRTYDLNDRERAWMDRLRAQGIDLYNRPPGKRLPLPYVLGVQPGELIGGGARDAAHD